jgi:Mce-associated membrane protein
VQSSGRSPAPAEGRRLVSDVTSSETTAADTPETEVSEGQATEEASNEPGAASGPSRSMVRNLAVLSVLFFVATVAMAVVAANQHRQLQQTRDTRGAVESVASRFASAVLTYDYRDLDKTKAAVLALATGKFRTDYEQNFSGLSALFTTTKGQSTATVKDVFVSGIDHDTASAIVVLDERGQGTSGQRLNVDWYLRLSLVKVRGTWRADDLINLNFAGQGPAAVPGQSNPTSAPPK